MPEDLIQSLVHFLLALSGLGGLGSRVLGPIPATKTFWAAVTTLETQLKPGAMPCMYIYIYI